MTQPNAAQTNKEMVNSASQTDRCRNASAIDPRAVSDGSNGMLVRYVYRAVTKPFYCYIFKLKLDVIAFTANS